MAKRAREQAIREKRERKQQKKDERRLAAAAPDVHEASGADDGSDEHVEQPLEDDTQVPGTPPRL